LSCEEQDEFLDALLLVKESGEYDDFVYIHEWFGELTHYTPEFLPWHRWFIWNFEKVLQQATGKCIYIPYWDWERDAEWEWDSDVMHPDTFGTWGETSNVNGRPCVNDGIADYRDSPFARSLGIDDGPLGCVEREFLQGFSFTGEAQMLAMITNYDQYADTSRGNNAVNGFRIEYENGPHMLVHGIIGGHMETNWSPADPVFWIHHSNIDRLWTLWQDYWDHDECHTDDYYAPWHYEGDLLDEELPFRNRAVDWDFRMRYEDGSRDHPTPRDVMSNDGPVISVTYMNDHLASLIPDYDANPRLIQTAYDDVDIKCDRDDWRRRKLQKGTASAERRGRETDDVPFRNSLRGDVTQDFVKADGTDDRPNSCQQNNFFTLQEDREEWDRLCRELPASTTVAERFAILAQRNCNRRGNPRSDADELKSRMKMKSMDDVPLPAFECFHRPDPA